VRRDQEGEWVARPVLADHGVVHAGERFLERSVATQPAHTARAEGRIEQIVGNRGPCQCEARIVHPLAYASEDFDLIRARQRRAHEPPD